MKKYLISALIFLAPFLALAEGFDRDLQFGMQNNSDVIKLQELLTDEGLYSGPISGNYFSLTQKAVKSFQTREGIKPASGYFGLKTRTKANTIFVVSVNASKDEVSIKSITSPVSVVSVAPVKIENNKSDTISSIMDQVAILQKQIDLLLKKTPTPPAQTTTVPQVIVQPESNISAALPVVAQTSPTISTQPQSTSVQATGNTTSSSVVNTWANGSFNAIGPNGVESYGVIGTLQP